MPWCYDVWMKETLGVRAANDYHPQARSGMTQEAHNTGTNDAQATAKPSPLAALFSAKYIFWIIAVLVITADLSSKAWAEEHVTERVERRDAPMVKDENGHLAYVSHLEYKSGLPPDGVEFWPGVLHFKWAENFGAAFSVGSGNSMLLAWVSIGVLGIIFYIMYRQPKGRWFLLFCLGLIAGGAVGNLYDRFTFHTIDLRPEVHGTPGFGKDATAVRDFLYWPFDIPVYSTWGLDDEAIAKAYTRKWPIFNIADACIVSGVIGWVGVSLFTRDPKKTKPPAQTTEMAAAPPNP